MKTVTKPSAEVNLRVPEPPGPEARVRPETGGETRTAGTIPPPPVLIL